jgi:hypothetical protein
MRWPGLAQFGGSTVSNGGNGASKARARLRTAVVGLLALNALLLALLYYRPGLTLSEQQADLVSARLRRDAAQETVAQMRQLREKLQVALQNGDQFAREHFQARNTGFSAILADLERRASESELTPAGITYRLAEQQDQPGWTSVDVTLAVEGEYPDLLRFIHQLEQSDLFWIIQSLTVAGDVGQGLRMNLQMQTYLVSS